MKQANSFNILFWAGLATALGSFGVVLTSVFYALSPIAAALPVAGVSMADAYQGMLSGRVTMMAAGISGVPSDIILIAGILLLLIFRTPAGLQIERLGLALLATGVVIFVFVDALAAGVLTQLAALVTMMNAFAGFKLLFDILFVFGTIAVGLGALLVFAGEIKAAGPTLAKQLAWIGILFSLVGLIASILYFFNIALAQLIGISIAVTSLIFAIYGIQIARQANSS